MDFCPGCGKESKGICKDCRSPREIEVRDINIKICASCNRYFYKNRWVKYDDLKKALERAAKEHVREKKFRLESTGSKIQLKPGLNQEITFKIIVKDDVFYVPGNIEVTYCDACSKQQGDYFEGTLQLRNINDTIERFIREYLKKNELFVSKEIKQPNGVDLNVTDNRKMQNLGVQLQKNFGGTLKVNPRIHTKDRQTSKQVYRVNVLYEAPDYKIGQIVKVDGKIIHVTNISKTVSGANLATGKHVSVDLKNKEYDVLKPKKARVSKVRPEIEVIEPDTYQSVPVRNKKDVKQGEKVKIVDDSGVYYIL